MPVVTIVSNAVASVEGKQAFTADLAAAFNDLIRTPKEHVHVLIDDGKFLSFGGDSTTPAAYVKIEASSRQILEDSRKQLVDRLVPLLKTLFNCDGYRTTTFFVEHPVEHAGLPAGSTEPMQVDVDVQHDVEMDDKDENEGSAPTGQTESLAGGATTRQSSVGHYIFSYGSNSKKQLLDRLNADVNPVSAYLDHHVRIFAGDSQGWKGGVASVYPKKGEKVYGALSKLTQKQLVTLDKFEGGYTRKRKMVTVNGSNGTHQIRAWVYYKNNTAFRKPPSVTYMHAIRRTLDDVLKTNTTRTDIIIRKVENKKVISIGYLAASDNKIRRYK